MMTFASWKSSAFAGALVAQVMYLAFELPTYQAMWGWQLTVPKDAGFSCEEGAVIGGKGKDAKFDCTVKADTGYKCDITKTSVVCTDEKAKNPFKNEVPSEVKCLNLGHQCDNPKDTVETTCVKVKDGMENDDTSTLSWMEVPSCKKDGGSGASPSPAAADVSANKAAFTGLSTPLLMLTGIFGTWLTCS